MRTVSKTMISAAWARQSRRLAHLILDTEVEGAEIIVILAASAWGILLCLPHDIFDSHPAYRQMRLALPKPVWALAAGGLATWQILAFLSRSRLRRRRGLLAAAGWWMCVAFLIFRAMPYALSGSLCVILSAASSWAFWRIHREEERTQIDTGHFFTPDGRPAFGHHPASEHGDTLPPVQPPSEATGPETEGVEGPDCLPPEAAHE